MLFYTWVEVAVKELPNMLCFAINILNVYWRCMCLTVLHYHCVMYQIKGNKNSFSDVIKNLLFCMLQFTILHVNVAAKDC